MNNLRRAYTAILILKMLSEIVLRIPFSVIGRCSVVPASHWLQGKRARINLSQAASGVILQNHRRLPVSIFCVKIDKQAETLSLIFFTNLETKIVKTIATCKENTYFLL
jgi:hypothetical protein